MSAQTEDESPISPADVQTVTDLVVTTVRPLRIVLFGSAARGELRAGSDLDMMVVVDEGSDTLRIAQSLHIAMLSIPDVAIRIAVDFVVTTPSRFEARRNSNGSVFSEIARDGREVYAFDRRVEIDRARAAFSERATAIEYISGLDAETIKRLGGV